MLKDANRIEKKTDRGMLDGIPMIKNLQTIKSDIAIYAPCVNFQPTRNAENGALTKKIINRLYNC